MEELTAAVLQILVQAGRNRALNCAFISITCKFILGLVQLYIIFIYLRQHFPLSQTIALVIRDKQGCIFLLCTWTPERQPSSIYFNSSLDFYYGKRDAV